MDLSALEKQILNTMARADRERRAMEGQIGAAAVISREYTNVGFFTKLSVPDDVASLDLGRWRLEDMPSGFAYHPSLTAGASFILWIKEGRIVTLEGFTNDGDWPADEAAFRVAV
jgi:hypothetical protein